MAQKDAYAACFIHRGNPVSTQLLHEHHVHPKGYGGQDDPENLIWLCGSCHDLVHRPAHLIKSKKQGQAHDLAFQFQASQNLSPAAKQRIVDLSKVVAIAMETYVPEADEESGFLDQDRVLVQLAIPRSIHKQAKALAANCTNPSSDRPMGLARYLERIIINHVFQLGNAPGLVHRPDKLLMAEDPPDQHKPDNHFNKID